jgi:sarcosine oxidase subunit beta
MTGKPAPYGRIVIVGGGVVGLSVAYNLAARGRTDVVVLERHDLGSGATSKATGGIRQQFTSEINARLSHRSVQIFQRFEEETGYPFAFRQHGYLFLLKRETDVAAFRAAVEMQNRIGIPSRVISPDEVLDIFPGVRVDDLLAATYCPTDGSAAPQDAVNGFAGAARRLGVQIRPHTEVTGFRREGDSIMVETQAGPVEAGIVILAPGPQARDVARMLGHDVPVGPHRRQAFAAEAGPWVTETLPLTVDLTTGAYIHPEGQGRLVVGGNDRHVPEGTDTTVDWSLAEPLIDALLDRFPVMDEVRLLRGWAGLREMTPDDHAVVGPLEPDQRVWVVSGFSGHGFMHSPAIGEAVAQLMTTGASDIDISALSPDRFVSGKAIAESVVF